MNDPFNKLVKIMEELRGANGCPWDREQTHQSIAHDLTEEVYEVIDAIDKQEPDKLKKELGDLLLQILFHSQLAKEEGLFDIKDVINHTIEKIVTRHPHVFSEARFNTTEEVLDNWERMKKDEEGDLYLNSIPKALPSLLYAKRLQEKVERIGFDWGNVSQRFFQSMERFRQNQGEEELGELLFNLVNFARLKKMNPEDILRRKVKEFITNFKKGII
ncbi:MAG: nucleoside triphosphate pyrophosphohydrolase [bacterium]|nr:nucleoside triphosphate pyrophosphohydrolase [bacterium]